jgi:histidine triad (HIT) family protein
MAQPVTPAGPTDPDCVFCRIVAGEVPAHVVHDGPDAVAFLDRTPLFEGHSLVVPRFHRQTLADVPASQLGAFFAVVQRLSVAVPEATGSAGSFVAMNNKVSQSVPHLHVHVVPRNRKDGLRGFFWPRRRYESEARMADVAADIRRLM